MPVYEYRCPQCGPFDEKRVADQARLPATCPRCAGSAARAYTAPATRTRSGPRATAGRADRARIDRALTGEPTVTSAPVGRRLPARPHGH